MMQNNEIFSSAKESIFGKPPTCKKALVGYYVSVNYFNYIINEAEAVLLQMEMPNRTLPIHLKNAFDFSSHDSFVRYPEESKNVIKMCTRNFRKRYEPLLKKLESKAA